MATPIHSVTVPLYAHTLRDDFPDSRDIKKLSDYLCSPTFALSIDSFLDIDSPLYALRCAYLKNSHLRLMTTNISPSPQQSLLSHLIREVHISRNQRILGHGDVPIRNARILGRY